MRRRTANVIQRRLFVASYSSKVSISIAKRTRTARCLPMHTCLLSSNSRLTRGSTSPDGKDCGKRWQSSFGRPLPIQINQTIIAHGSKSDWEGILNEFAVNRPYFNDINYATAMSRLAKHKPSVDDPRMQQMIQDVTEDLSKIEGIHCMGIQGVSNCLHALSKLRQNDALRTILPVVDTLEVAENIVERSRPQAIATILWSSAKSGIPIPNLCDFVCRDADRLAQVSKGRDVASIVWSLAKLNVKDTTWFSSTLEDQVYKIAASQHQQDLINCVWACAKAGSTDIPRLLALVEQKAPWLVRQPQDISNAVWSFATLRVMSKGLFDVLEKNSREIIRDGQPQAVANCAWACSVMKFEAPQLFHEIEVNATRLGDTANATELASIVTAAVKSNQRLPNFFAAVDANADRVVHDRVGNPQALANILWAMAKQKLALMRLYDVTIRPDQVAYIFDHGSVQEVTIIAWSLQTLDSDKFTRSAYCQELLQRSDKIRSSGDTKAVATLEDILNKVRRRSYETLKNQ